MKPFFAALAITASLTAGALFATGSALANVDSPFYPDHLKAPSLPNPSVGAGSGIPRPYRIGD